MIAVPSRFRVACRLAGAVGQRLRWLVFFAAVVAVGSFAHTPASSHAANSSKPLPKFEKIQQITQRHFAAEELEAGEILARSEAEPLFDLLKRAGWSVPDYKTILKAILKDSDFLVQQLRRGRGIEFARQIAKIPGGYDRLDRLASMPQGRQTLRDLIRGPDGKKLIEYLSTTDGGTELGRMLGNTQKGKHFNEPTERIYTVEQLVEVLRRKYAETRNKKQKAGDK